MDNQPMSPNGAPRSQGSQTPPVAPNPQGSQVNQPQPQAPSQPLVATQPSMTQNPDIPATTAQVQQPTSEKPAEKKGLAKLVSGTSIVDIVKAAIKGESTKTPEELMVKTVAKTYEINLVPDIKAQMIRALKIRNLVLFGCIIVSIVSVSIIAVLFSIKSGQDIAMHNQDNRLETLSNKLNGFAELNELVTIQGQVDKIDEISRNKTMVSRVLGALNASLPNSVDTVQFSEVRVDLSTNTVRMEGQTNAMKAPDNDYRVLEEFKKAVGLVKFDYGRFVDAEGNQIPTWCIIEAGENGEAFKEGDNYYVWWDLTVDGCAGKEAGSSNSRSSSSSRSNSTSNSNASSNSSSRSSEDDDKATLRYSKDAEVETSDVMISDDQLSNYNIEFTLDGDNNRIPVPESLEEAGIVTKEEDGESVRYHTTPTRVKIWRTPRFDDWYKSGNMTESGSISGIEHFVSECTRYSGLMLGRNSDGTVNMRWSSNNECGLTANDGLNISSSANARDEGDQLVLKFSASMNLNEDFFLFRNKHMVAIGPSRQNVTDSYLQVGGMFTRSATECQAGDTECLSNTTNSRGNN